MSLIHETLAPELCEVYDAIRDGIETDGLAPTQQELAELLSVSVGSVNSRIKALARLGLVRVVKGRRRRGYRGILLAAGRVRPATRAAGGMVRVTLDGREWVITNGEARAWAEGLLAAAAALEQRSGEWFGGAA